jgi:ankyrin repeat protein
MKKSSYLFLAMLIIQAPSFVIAMEYIRDIEAIAIFGNPGQLKYLLAEIRDPDQIFNFLATRDRFGSTPLHLAATSGQKEIAEMFVNAIPNLGMRATFIMMQNYSGFTASDCAVVAGYTSIKDMLNNELNNLTH